MGSKAGVVAKLKPNF